MPSNLTDRQIRRMHQLYADGFSKLAIAQILGINRNTVHTHLSGRVAYHVELARKLGTINRPLCDDDPMPIYLASEYLPGAPRPVSTFLLHKAGILKARIQRRGKYRTKMLVATHRDISRAAKSLLPPGLWVRVSRLKALLADDVLFSKLENSARIQERRAMANRFFLWIDVSNECAAIGAHLQPEPGEISKALKTFKLTGVGWF